MLKNKRISSVIILQVFLAILIIIDYRRILISTTLEQSIIFLYLVVFAFTVIFLTPRRRYFPSVILLLITLSIYGITGAIIGRLLGYESGLLTMLIMNTILLSNIYFENKIRLDFKYISYVTYLFFYVQCVSVASQIIFPGPFQGITHERAYLLGPAIVLSLISRNPKNFIPVLISCLIILLLDPRTTLILVYIVSFLIYAMYYLPFKITRILLAVSLVLSAASYNLIPSYIAQFNTYFKSNIQSNGDNNKFREYMLDVGIRQFELGNKIIGTGFTSGGAYQSIVEVNGNTNLPLHNDFLEYLVSGGLIGFTLFITILFLITRSLLGVLSMNRELTAIGLTLMIGFVITAGFNPVLNNFRASYPLFILMSVYFVYARRYTKDEEKK